MPRYSNLCKNSFEKALALDSEDMLANKRLEFDIPDGIIYLDGNSLGALPVVAKERAKQVIEQQWGRDLITSWNSHNWIDLPIKVGEKIAKIIGAKPGQTICCDSISINLFKLLSAALRINSSRSLVLTERSNFPTDIYMAQGLQSLLGKNRCNLKCVENHLIESSLDDNVAVLMLTQVDFRTGAMHDLAKLTALAQSKGILVIWDLAHSAGAIPVELDNCNVDFAVGCGYKYLNGGPGAPAFIYVAKRHQAQFQQPLFGWMGHKNAFQFSSVYQASEDISQCLTGTPAILSMSVLDAALTVFENVDMLIIRSKSILLGEYFIELMQESGMDEILPLRSSVNSQERASQLAFAHPKAYAICQALIAQNVIGDFRAPDILRIGFTPLYTRFIDVFHCVSILSEIIINQRFESAKFQQSGKVT